MCLRVWAEPIRDRRWHGARAGLHRGSCREWRRAAGSEPESFQPEQLAREYVTLLNAAADRVPLFLLVLGAPPPIAVKGCGRLDPIEAVSTQLDALLDRAHNYEGDAESLTARLPDALAWITWAEIREIVVRQAAGFTELPHGLVGTVDRLASAVVTAIDWHS